MDRENWKNISIALRSKPSKIPMEWSEVSFLYMRVVQQIPDEFAEPLLMWILIECDTFRPTTDQLYAWYRGMTGDREKSGADVALEIRAAVSIYGAYAQRDSEAPGVRVAGAPVDLSVEARELVKRRGGWMALCTTPWRSEDQFWRDVARDAEEICRYAREWRKRKAAVDRVMGAVQGL